MTVEPTWRAARCRRGGVSLRVDAPMAPCASAWSLLFDGGRAGACRSSATRSSRTFRRGRRARRAVRARSTRADATQSRTALGDVDWSERWKHGIACRLGAPRVAPPWLAEDSRLRRRTIVIEPGMAFGTGEHATTRGVLRLMQSVIRPAIASPTSAPAARVLAIAAAKLGARARRRDRDRSRRDRQRRGERRAQRRRRRGDGDRGRRGRAAAARRAGARRTGEHHLVGARSSCCRSMRARAPADGRAVISGILVSERDAHAWRRSRRGWLALEPKITRASGGARDRRAVATFFASEPLVARRA